MSPHWKAKAGFVIVWLFTLAAVALTMAGCAGIPKDGPSTLLPVCHALGAPILYNPTNKNSDWHAGKKLATRIDQQDDTGKNLRCKGY